MRKLNPHKKKGLCQVAFCQRKARSYKTKNGTSYEKRCHTHNREYQKETNPLRYFYDLLRGNAKYRGHSFSLTIKEFEKFCEETNYLQLKGTQADAAHIDRKNPNKGYTYENIRLLSCSGNSRKQWVDLKLMRKYGIDITSREDYVETVDEILVEMDSGKTFEEVLNDSEIPF